jgi:single-stranded-DNA-specific exonuclease
VELRGSCRSDGVVNVVELMGAAREVFGHFGGHHASGGFSVLEEKVHELLPRLVTAHAAVAGGSPGEAAVEVDRELPLAEVARAHASLKQMAPFGTGFEKPLFIIPDVSIAGVRAFGKTQNHLGVSLEKDGVRMEGIAFFSTPDSFDKKVTQGVRATVVGNVEADWRGGPRVRVVDVI